MYKLSARQILVIALISGVFAAGSVAVLDRVAGRLQPSSSGTFGKRAGEHHDSGRGYRRTK